ncbi:hypothetical protein FG386_003504 [Cryptosporidium ryanae]|uniref:uncharacterized protein n=1 Tax=Cryptosporidium ryanae TaxID=515981 RepID=UPI00351A6839|nr:hypothetical protein FG386_003504 [Cryptosporidium ryanae]
MFLFNNNVHTGDLFSGRTNRAHSNVSHQPQLRNTLCSVDKLSLNGGINSSVLLNSGNKGFISGATGSNSLYINPNGVSAGQAYIDQLTQYNQYLQQLLIMTQNKLQDYNLNMQYHTQSIQNHIQNVGFIQGVCGTRGINGEVNGIKQMVASVSPIYYGSPMGNYQNINRNGICAANVGGEYYFNMGICSDSINNIARNFEGNLVFENKSGMQEEGCYGEYDILLLPRCENKLTVRDVSHSELSLKSSSKKEDAEVEVIIKNGDKSVEFDCLKDELLSENKIHCDKKLANEIEVDLYENEGNINNSGSYQLKEGRNSCESIHNSQFKVQVEDNSSQLAFTSEEICQELVFDFENSESKCNDKEGSKQDESDISEKRKGEIEIDEDSLLVIKYKNNGNIEQDLLNIMEGNMNNCVIDGNSYYNENIVYGYQNHIFTVNNHPEVVEVINGNLLSVEIGTESGLGIVREEEASLNPVIPLEYVENSNIEIGVPAESEIQELEEYRCINEEESEDETSQLLNDKIGRYNLLLEKINKIEEMNILMKQVVLNEKRRYYDELSDIEGQRSDEYKEANENCYLNENEIDSLGLRNSFETVRDYYKSNSTVLFCDDKDDNMQIPDEHTALKMSSMSDISKNNEVNATSDKNYESFEHQSMRDIVKQSCKKACDEECGGTHHVKDQMNNVESENGFKGSEEQMEDYIRTINSYFSSHVSESSCESILNTQRWEKKYQTAMNSLKFQINQQEYEESENEDDRLRMKSAKESNNANSSLESSSKKKEFETRQEGIVEMCKNTEKETSVSSNGLEIVKENGLVIINSSLSIENDNLDRKTKDNAYVPSPLSIEQKTGTTRVFGSQDNFKIRDNEILERLSQCRVINSKSVRNSSTVIPSKYTNTELNPCNQRCFGETETKTADTQNLGFRSLINNGIKVKVSELVKPRIIKKNSNLG